MKQKPLIYNKKLLKVGHSHYLNIPKVFIEANGLDNKKRVRLTIRNLKTIEVIAK